MKKHTYFIGLGSILIIPSLTYSQVGIGTESPDSSAILELKSDNKGVLFPRVQLTDIEDQSTVLNPALGLVVFNLADSGAIGKEVKESTFYVWKGTIWESVKQEIESAIGTGGIYGGSGSLSSSTIVNQGVNSLSFTSTATTGTSHFTVDGTTLNVDAVNNRLGVGTNVPDANLHVVGSEVKIGASSTVTGAVDNPLLRIHSKGNADGLGGEIRFNENDIAYGYYIKHNTAPGVNGVDGISIGSQIVRELSKPGIFISDVQDVGLGTGVPRARFHIDGNDGTGLSGKGDNNITTTPTVQQYSNDVVVLRTGNMGLGIVNPTEKLEVNGKTKTTNLQVTNNPGVGRVLISDATGNASWANGTSVRYVSGVIGATGINTSVTANAYTGCSITLPPGKWLVNVQQLVNFGTGSTIANNFSYWVVTTFSDGSSSFSISPDIIGGANIATSLVGPSRYSMMSGAVRIENKGTTPKTYYYWVRNIGGTYGTGGTAENLYKFGSRDWGENNIYATQILE